MVAASIVFLVLAIVVGLGGAALHRHSSTFNRAVGHCSRCGGRNRAAADALNARLVLECENPACRNLAYHSVRASAMSLFGVVRIVLIGLGAMMCWNFGALQEFGVAAKLGTLIVSLLLVSVFASFLVRLVALVLMQADLPPSWQAEIVAHLAPPPWRSDQVRPADDHRPSS